MKGSNVLLTKAHALLADKMSFVIAMIVSHKGSTPRTSGTKMLITGDGQINGTIGGGLLEADVIKKAKEIIALQHTSVFMPFDLSCDNVATMDMICGGEAQIFLDYITPTTKNVDAFNRWKFLSERGSSSYLITIIVKKNNQIKAVYHDFAQSVKTLKNKHGLADEILESVRLEVAGFNELKVLKQGNITVLIEKDAKPKNVFLFGAGHVAKPTAHLCALTGFHVTVLDDRKGFANVENFKDAHAIQVLENFEDAISNIEIDNDSFVVVFTRGHLHDRTVLAQVLRTKAGYIGMIGSKKKRDAIYKTLLKSGYSQSNILRVHSPIGLSINAKSLEEIAVSIVAEMIKERSLMLTERKNICCAYRKNPAAGRSRRCDETKDFTLSVT